MVLSQAIAAPAKRTATAANCILIDLGGYLVKISMKMVGIRVGRLKIGAEELLLIIWFL